VRPLLLRVPPSDRAVLVLLLLAAAVVVVWLPFHHWLVPMQLGMLAGWVVAVAGMACWERWRGVQFVRPALTVGVIFTCYTTLGRLGVDGMPYLVDAELSRIDTWFWGADPSIWLQRFQTPGWVEFFSFIYGSFIPYIYLSLALGCLGRPPLERDQFVTGWVFLYVISYLGYIFVPARGPASYHEFDYHVALQGGIFHQLVVAGMQSSGGLQGVFPSLHVGGSVYLCLFDLRTHRLRGLTYLPMVLLIYLATIFLRYHYIIDLVAGTVLAVGCIPLGERVFLRWMRRRETAGLPALPGGEADDLPALSDTSTSAAAPLLPAN
jgi:hypothetical protein